jgi:hypothetical protein
MKNNKLVLICVTLAFSLGIMNSSFAQPVDCFNEYNTCSSSGNGKSCLEQLEDCLDKSE